MNHETKAIWFHVPPVLGFSTVSPQYEANNQRQKIFKKIMQ